MQRRTPNGRRRRSTQTRAAATAIALALVTGTLAVTVQPVGAVHDADLFELGVDDPALGTDIAGNGDPTDGPDWADLFNAQGEVQAGAIVAPGLAATFVDDDLSSKGLVDQTTFASSNKNNDPVSTWNWDKGNNPPKDDLSNIYGYATRTHVVDEAPSGDLIVYVGIERLAPEGDSHIDIELNQDDIGLDEDIPCNDPGPDPTPCAFVGEKTVDDVLIVMDFENGGSVGFLDIRKWNGVEYEEVLTVGGEGCNPANSFPVDVVCGFNNGKTIPTGSWQSYDRHGTPVINLEPNAFTEVGLNITQLLDVSPGAEPCITSINAKSRTSASFNSELKDFALGSFDVCRPTTDLVVSDAPATITVGDSLTVTFSETNDGDVELTAPALVTDPTADLSTQRNSFLASADCTVAYDSGDDGDGVLDPDETWDFTCTTTPAAEGTVTLTAYGHGIDHLGRDITCVDSSDPDCSGNTALASDHLEDVDEVASVDVLVLKPSTTVSVSSGATLVGSTPTVHGGDTVTLDITEQNDGNAPLMLPVAGDRTSIIELNSSECSNLTYVSGDQADGDTGAGILGPNETWSFTCSFTAPTDADSHDVTVTGHGIDELGRDVTWCDEEGDAPTDLSVSPATAFCDPDERDSITISVLNPDTSIKVLASAVVTYTIYETNDGNTDLYPPTAGDRTSIVDVEATCENLTYVSGDQSSGDGSGILEPNETWVFTCTETVEPADADSSTVSDSATATGHGVDDLGADTTYCGSGGSADCATDERHDADERDGSSVTVTNDARPGPS
ncbi:MAG TPA: hypothetical protein VGA13_02845 [Acidimicrobiales bacterium]